ncbi:MAG: DUF2207 domain-containing protein [Gemmatimonadota bacterium]
MRRTEVAAAAAGLVRPGRARRVAGPALALAALLLAFPFGPHLAAQERILSYDSEIEILPDGSMEVEERIIVRAEGNQIRRGIYRDFPTRYEDRYGNRVLVDFEVLGVERNGRPEPWFTEGLSNGVRLNTGNDDFLTIPAEYTFTLRYRTDRQLGFFENWDELYWNAIGTGWIFPIERGEVVVRLPEAVSTEAMSAEGYTGPQGAQGNDYVAEIVEPGVARYRLTGGLGPREGFTIVLTFPKGVIPEPTQVERAERFFSDNIGVFVALLGLLGFLLFTISRWRRIGRDPAPGIIIARYEPSPGFTPGGVRYQTRMGYDARCFSSDVLDLAVAGHLEIAREKGFFKDVWKLHRAHGGVAAELPASQRKLLSGLFPGGMPTITLKDTNAAVLSAAREAHKKELNRFYSPKYFKRNGGSLAIAMLIAVASSVLALILSGGFGIPVIILAATVMAVGLLAFGLAIKAPTPEGRRLLDEIEGLKLYLSVAERDDLARIEGPDAEGPDAEAASGASWDERGRAQTALAVPPVDADRFESLLPYAVALGVEEAWTEKFTAAVGEAAATAATQSIAWYHGPGRITDMGGFTQSLGSSLSSTISSASSPPGSSSGSGGGGSSGGGGGGGGGGGR